MARLGGILELKVNGTQYLAKGEFEYNLGIPKKEYIIGADGSHGYKEMPQVAYISGAVTDSPDFSMTELRRLRDATIVLRLANGKVISLEEAIESSDGSVKSEEGEAEVRFEGSKATEIIS